MIYANESFVQYSNGTRLVKRYPCVNSYAMNTPAQRIAAGLDEAIRSFNGGRGISQAELSRRSGVPQPTISRTLSARSIPESNTLMKIISVVGRNPTLDGALKLLLPPVTASLNAVEAGDATSSRAEIKDASAIPDLLPIKRADFKLSAGVSGYEIEYSHEDDRPPIFMGKRWFEENQYNPDKLLAIKVSGRSMEPRMYDGDLVIINLDNTKLVDGQAVAANYEGELVIKRMKRDGGQWYLASDNPDKVIYGDKVCQGDCGILGWVVYRQTEHV